MCLNCMSAAEAAMAQAAFVGYVVKAPVHRVLARAGLVAAPDPVAHDARTVVFLRSLDLDPVAILGADVVAAAESRLAASAFRPAESRPSRQSVFAPVACRLPIGSQSRLATT